jgi:mevalonate kinase
MAAISRSAPGKLILCGEHVVVYHQPAIAVPVTQVASATKIFANPLGRKGEVKVIASQIGIDKLLSEIPDSNPIQQSIHILLGYFKIDHLPACEIRISSTIPIGSGLGSSASSSVSLVRAVSDFLGKPLGDEETNQLAFEMEKIHHGNPSGIDNTVITYARPISFVREEPIEFIKLVNPLELLIADTGIQASTMKAVGQVKEEWQKEPQKLESLFEKAGNLTREIKQLMLKGEIASIGPLLTQNHRILQDMGVSCPELDHLVTAALDAGALGAKLSGGGLGGNMLALVGAEHLEGVQNSLTKAGAVSIIHTTVQPMVGN